MPIVFAAPKVAPPTASRLFRDLGVTWTAYDGTVFNLRDWRTGVALMLDGVSGLHNPKITKYKSTSRAVPGYRGRGWRTESRDVFWPLYLWGDGSDEWLSQYDGFFRTIHPELAGTWSVTAAGKTRTIKLTGRFDNEHEFERDPYKAGWSVIPVELEPEQPYWEGDQVTVGPYGAPDDVDFIQGVGAPPFHISEATSFTSARVTNPGDVDAWLVWELEGPLDGIDLGVGGVVGTVPFDLNIGDRLVIDTDPRHVAATLNGADATADLGLMPFGPVRPGRDVELTVSATGDGAVRASLKPLYFRAF